MGNNGWLRIKHQCSMSCIKSKGRPLKKVNSWIHNSRTGIGLAAITLTTWRGKIDAEGNGIKDQFVWLRVVKKGPRIMLDLPHSSSAGHGIWLRAGFAKKNASEIKFTAVPFGFDSSYASPTLGYNVYVGRFTGSSKEQIAVSYNGSIMLYEFRPSAHRRFVPKRNVPSVKNRQKITKRMSFVWNYVTNAFSMGADTVTIKAPTKDEFFQTASMLMFLSKGYPGRKIVITHRSYNQK